MKELFVANIKSDGLNWGLLTSRLINHQLSSIQNQNPKTHNLFLDCDCSLNYGNGQTEN